MYAIVKTGGKQYRVAPGQILKLEKLAGEPGSQVELDQVLLVASGDNIKIGAPLIAGVKVSAEVIEQGRREKIKILKFRRRKHHMKRMGHRQSYTKVKITDIQGV